MKTQTVVYCEKCDAEHKTKHTFCPDCGTALVEKDVIITPPDDAVPMGSVVPDELGRNIKQLEDKLVNMATTDDLDKIKSEYTKALDELQRNIKSFKNSRFDAPGGSGSTWLKELLGERAIDLCVRQYIEGMQGGRSKGSRFVPVPLTQTEYWKKHFSHVTKADWQAAYKDYFVNDVLRESYLAQHKMTVKDALDTAEDGDLVPTIAGMELWRLVRDETRLLNFLPVSTMIGNTFTNPIYTADGTIYSWTEQTLAKNPGTQHSIRGSKPTFSQVTWALGKLIHNIPFSYELEEDAIIELIRVLKEEATLAFSEEIAYVLIRGDETTTTGDNINATGVADTPTTTAGAADSYLAVDGIDHEILITGGGTNSADVAALTIDDLYAAETALGVFGLKRDKTIILVNVEGWVRLKQKLTQTQDLGTMGPQATILSGQLGSINGYRIIVDEQRVNTEQGEAGQILLTPVTQLPAFNMIYTPGCPVKVSARGVVMQDWDEVQEQQRGFVQSLRMDIQFPYGDSGLYMGYDIDA